MFSLSAVTVLWTEKLFSLTNPCREKAVSLYHSITDEGLRVLAFAYKKVKSGEVTERMEDAEKDMVFLGLIGLEDPPRPEVPEAIRKCGEAGIRIIMITGDGSRTALAIAREIGLVRKDPTVVEGDEFLRMSDDELRACTGKGRDNLLEDDAEAQTEGCEYPEGGGRKGCRHRGWRQ